MSIPSLMVASVCYGVSLATSQNLVSCNFHSGTSAGGRYMLCNVTYEPDPITRTVMAITYAGLTCSYIAHIEGTLTDPDQRNAVFGLRNPPVGQNAIQVTMRSATGVAGLQVCAVVYSGVDQNDPIGNVSTSVATLINAAATGTQIFTPRDVGSRVVAFMASEGGNLPLDGTANWSSVLQNETDSGFGVGTVIGHYGTSSRSAVTLNFSNNAAQPYGNSQYSLIMAELRQSGTNALVSKPRSNLPHRAM